MKTRRFGRTELQISELVFGGGWVGGLLIQKVEGALEDLNAAIDGNLYVMPKGQEDRPRWWLETASGGGDRGWSGWQSAGYDRNGSRLSVDDPVAWLRQHHPKAAALLN